MLPRFFMKNERCAGFGGFDPRMLRVKHAWQTRGIDSCLMAQVGLFLSKSCVCIGLLIADKQPLF